MKMKRRGLLLLVAVLLLFSFTVHADGEAQIVSVYLNGEQIEFDVPAQVINDRTMVPMRKIFETLGATVDWVESEQGIVAAKDSKIIVMVIGSEKLLVTDLLTGEENVSFLDVPPMILNDRTLVPLRALSESLGLTVEWVEEDQSVLLTD